MNSYSIKLLNKYPILRSPRMIYSIGYVSGILTALGVRHTFEIKLYRS